MLVIHENRGLTAHIRNVAGRFAAQRAGRRWRSTCSPRRAAPARSRTRPRSWPRCRRSRQATAGRFDDDMKAAVDRDREARRAPGAALGDRLLLRRRHDLAPAGAEASRGCRRPRRSTARSRPAATCTATRPTCSASTAASTTASTRRSRRRRRRSRPRGWTTRSSRSPRPTTRSSTTPTAARFNAPAAEEAWRRVIDWFDDADDDRGHGTAGTTTRSGRRDRRRRRPRPPRGCGWRRWPRSARSVCVKSPGSDSTREQQQLARRSRARRSRGRRACPSTPSRIAAQRFSSIRHASCTGSGSPASKRAASACISPNANAATPRTSSTLDCASGARSSSVP